ncbi:MAG: PTS transporter subunit EIIC [Collinsella sp.]
MESIVKFLEKGQPYFDKVSKNIYLQAIKDGFLAAMPIILSSSVFLLISTLPGVVATVGGFTLPDWWNVDVVNFCNKVYNFTMGVVGIMVAGTTASALTGSKNRRMPAGSHQRHEHHGRRHVRYAHLGRYPDECQRSTAPMSRCSLPTTWAPRAY